MAARDLDNIFGVSGSIFSSHLIKYNCILENILYYRTEQNRSKTKHDYLKRSLKADKYLRVAKTLLSTWMRCLLLPLLSYS